MSTPRPSPTAVAVAVAADVAAVVIFVLIGRSSHREGFSFPGMLTTLWPFAAGLGAGWLAMRTWRDPLGIVWTGVGVWIATVAVGVLLRAASGQGVQPSFVIVTSIVLAVFLVGWRGLARVPAIRRAIER